MLEQDGNLDDAIAELKHAADRDPEYAEPYYALARIYRGQGLKTDADVALATFERLHDAKRATPSQ